MAKSGLLLKHFEQGRQERRIGTFAALVAAIVNGAPEGSSGLTQDMALSVGGGFHELPPARMETGETAAIGSRPA